MLTPLVTLILVGALAPAPLQTPAHAKAAAPHSASKSKAHTTARGKTHAATRHRAATPARADGISDARALEIQQALVQAGYLDHASGHWDAATSAAMAHYQKDRNWQTRYVPDARALIALGLGPAGDSVPALTTAANPPSPDSH